jgi:hypothetical protein
MHRDRTPGYLTKISPHHPPGGSGRLRLGSSFALFGVLALSLLLLPTASRLQQGHILYVNHNDPTCQGHAPCYQTVQAAMTAAVAGDTIRIQAGTYQEQVNINGKNNIAGATEADRITLEADPAGPVGSVILAGAVSQCTNGYAIRKGGRKGGRWGRKGGRCIRTISVVRFPSPCPANRAWMPRRPSTTSWCGGSSGAPSSGMTGTGPTSSRASRPSPRRGRLRSTPGPSCPTMSTC